MDKLFHKQVFFRFDKEIITLCFKVLVEILQVTHSLREGEM